ncbi:ABC transporter permease subunit [Virgibacillus sp. 179-BFC.A HS]|uniref:ABC transporter permease subunit n=1 Tax=Tigheibacillus jepli TaxID=3035914 RepID=A0ABU5CDV4_9BACI|nr:ABC transporter permease subunit [Virgibacillus sp. 179-BFC.A HS]MDY0404461.1 ABC transporter permease subunit [Virgibacillus sp. 179-BFC.A HS]
MTWFTPFGAEEQYSFWQKAVFELIILTIVAIPTTSLLIGNQINQVYKEEFISSAKTLGGSRFFILKKHVLPHMKPRILIQFTQEIVQVLILLIHLGFFRILFGGTSELGYDPSQKVYISLSSEWSGMVGEGFGHLNGWWWTFSVPPSPFRLLFLH